MDREQKTSFPIALWAAALVICALAVTAQSFWIDEANSALKAIQPTWAQFWAKNLDIGGSDLQMPLYMAALWIWEKVVGPSEYALRALNIPLFLAALGGVAYLLDRSRAERIAFFALACVSPMLWAYLDEARPYLMQFLASTILMLALVGLASKSGAPSSRLLFLGLTGAVLLCASSLTGVIYTFFFGMVFLILWQSRENVLRIFRTPTMLGAVIGTGLLMALLGAYYYWTLMVGARAANLSPTSISTTIFCIYELMGATGLGPGRSALRDAGAGALTVYLPYLGAFFLITALVWIIGGRSLLRQSPVNWRMLLLFAGAGLGAATMVLLGIVMNFRVVGRHLMPLLPFLLLAQSFMLCALWQSPHRRCRALVVAFLLILAISALSVRMSHRFAKDDYRGAAALVKETVARHGIAWWAGDPAAAAYYGVFPGYPGEPCEVFFANARSTDYLARLPLPEIVVLSKPDIYDPSGDLRAFLTGHSYRETSPLAAMTLWQKNRQ